MLLFLTSKEQVERYIFINNVYQTLIGISMVLHGRTSNPFYKFSSVVVCKFLCQHFMPRMPPSSGSDLTLKVPAYCGMEALKLIGINCRKSEIKIINSVDLATLRRGSIAQPVFVRTF